MHSCYGSHGTSYSRYSAICNSGFKIGSGRGGSGIYFWKKSHYFEKLAIGWYKYQLSLRRYAHDQDQRGVIIKVNLTVEDDRLIDLEDPDLKDNIAKLALDKNIDSDNDREIAGIYDLFIKKIEEKIGKKLYVIEIRVAPPLKEFCPEYPIKLIGAPYCYVAREKSCIKITNIELM